MAGLNSNGRALLKTIVYYDCLNYPLTLEELEIFDLSAGLKILQEKNLIENSDGFYFLKGRRDLVRERLKKNEIAKDKWAKALKAIKWLQAVPFVRLVFASGSLALKNTTRESDLDVLIMAKFGRIWTARFLTAGILSLLGVRRTRYQKTAPDKVCLNHFITDKSLKIPFKSIFTAQLYSRLVPILVEDAKVLEDFLEENSWISEYVVSWPNCLHTEAVIKNNSNFLKFLKNLSEKILNGKIGDWVESVLRRYQLKRIRSGNQNHQAPGRIEANDYFLAFHPDSPEFRVIEKFNETMRRLGFEDLTEKTSFATKNIADL